MRSSRFRTAAGQAGHSEPRIMHGFPLCRKNLPVHAGLAGPLRAAPMLRRYSDGNRPPQPHRYPAGAARLLSAMNARTCDSSTGSGTEPCLSTASWKALMSKRSPSSRSASARSLTMAISPSL